MDSARIERVARELRRIEEEDAYEVCTGKRRWPRDTWPEISGYLKDGYRETAQRLLVVAGDEGSVQDGQ